MRHLSAMILLAATFVAPVAVTRAQTPSAPPDALPTKPPRLDYKVTTLDNGLKVVTFFFNVSALFYI